MIWKNAYENYNFKTWKSSCSTTNTWKLFLLKSMWDESYWLRGCKCFSYWYIFEWITIGCAVCFSFKFSNFVRETPPITLSSKYVGLVIRYCLFLGLELYWLLIYFCLLLIIVSVVRFIIICWYSFFGFLSYKLRKRYEFSIFWNFSRHLKCLVINMATLPCIFNRELRRMSCTSCSWNRKKTNKNVFYELNLSMFAINEFCFYMLLLYARWLLHQCYWITNSKRPILQSKCHFFDHHSWWLHL